MTIISRTDDRGCGCDAVTSKRLLGLDQALAEIVRKTRPLEGTERVSLKDAIGRVLGEPVRALGMVPPFANAAMDGYAINTADLAGDGPWNLPVTDRIAAGETPRRAWKRNTAVQIFTGAPVPDGANAVVMQEDVQHVTDGICLTRRVTPRTHIRAMGEDMAKDKIVAPAGRLLTARDLAVCVAAGHSHLTVCRPLRVALLVTGNEVCQPGDRRGSAGIWDINTPMLCAAIESPAVKICLSYVAADTKSALARQLAALSKSVDLVVTTGGISVGGEDHVKPALLELGAWIGFSGVAVKPGKPVSFGRFNDTNWLGLPGNPLAAFLTWQVLGKQLCHAMTGQAQPPWPRRPVTLSRRLCRKPGRCELRLARLTGFDDLGREVVEFADATHSGRVANLPEMDGILIIPADVATLPKGAQVEFQPF